MGGYMKTTPYEMAEKKGDTNVWKYETASYELARNRKKYGIRI